MMLSGYLLICLIFSIDLVFGIYYEQRLDGGTTGVDTDLITDNFGYSVASYKSTVVVGCFTCDGAGGTSSGLVFVYTETNPNDKDWGDAEVIIDGSDTGSVDYFGIDVDIDGVNLVVGAKFHNAPNSDSGAIYVYSESGESVGDWGSEVKLISGAPEGNGAFGSGVAINGRRVAGGQPSRGSFLFSSGNCRIMLYTESAAGARDWANDVVILSRAAPVTDDMTGIAMDFEDTYSHGGDDVYLVAGQPGYPGETDPYAGAVTIFYADGGDDNFQANQEVLTQGDAVLREYGFSVGVDGTGVIAVGAPADASLFTSNGAVYVYTPSSVGARDWSSNVDVLYASDAATGNRFGYHVSVTPLHVIVSTPYWPTDVQSLGAMYLFSETSTGAGDWTEYETIFTPSYVENSATPRFGWDSDVYQDSTYSITMFGGSPYDDQVNGADSGSVYVYYECPPGKAGQNCLNVDDCPGHACANGATCVDDVDSYTCDCVSGYTGTLCETDIDDCESNPCWNGGICSDDGPNAYFCDCSGLGWTGPKCMVDVDDCSSSPCENDGICDDTGNQAFSCDCSSTGFFGDLCTDDEDDCESSPCSYGGLCIDLGLKVFECDCTDTGFTGDTCDDDNDDCAGFPFPCQHGGKCTDLGFKSFICDCANTGYTGTQCETDLDDCASSPCVNGGICKDVGGNLYSCDCDNTGFDGWNCDEQFDHCSSDPCENGAMCTAEGSMFVCTCGAGYTGETCADDIDDCTSSPCFNNGLCTDAGLNAFTCDCSDTDFTGNDCSEEVASSCNSSPCQNGGTCSDAANGFICTCLEEWDGDTCTFPMFAAVYTSSYSSSFNSTSSEIEEGTCVTEQERAACNRATIEVDLGGFASEDEEATFVALLPEVVSNTVGANENQLEIIPVTNEDGTLTITVIYYYPVEEEEEVEQQWQADNLQNAIADDTGTIVSVNLVDNTESTPDDATEEDDNTVMVILIVVGVALLLGTLGAAKAYNNRNNKNIVDSNGRVYAMPV